MDGFPTDLRSGSWSPAFARGVPTDARGAPRAPTVCRRWTTVDQRGSVTPAVCPRLAADACGICGGPRDAADVSAGASRRTVAECTAVNHPRLRGQFRPPVPRSVTSHDSLPGAVSCSIVLKYLCIRPHGSSLGTRDTLRYKCKVPFVSQSPNDNMSPPAVLDYPSPSTDIDERQDEFQATLTRN